MGDVIITNSTKLKGGAGYVMIPIVFSVANAVAGAVVYVAKRIEFPEDNIVGGYLKKARERLGIPNSFKKEKEIFRKRIEDAKRNFESYQSMHEEFLTKDIQQCIDRINKNKAKVKERVLVNLSVALKKLGIDSEMKDYPLEVLDYRKFPLEDKFEIIREQNEKIEKYGKEISDIYFIIFPVNAFLHYFSNLRKLHEASENFQKESEAIVKQMNKELDRMCTLHVALDNISNIFINLINRYVPIIEEFTEDVIKKYSSYEEVPNDVLLFIKNSTWLLKGICEKRIIDCSSLDRIKEYNDELVLKYSSLNALFMKTLPTNAA